MIALLCSTIGIHVTYLLLLRRLSRRAARLSYDNMVNINRANISKTTSLSLPLVSVIIPVFNEELVIERRLYNIFESTYPRDKIEVIVVDSGSNDRTHIIIDKKFRDKLLLIREEVRKGKAHAINLALKKCRGEIVLLTDGPALYEKETIFHIVTSFEDPSVAGVSVLYRIPNTNENQITASENIFWSYKDKIRVLESKACSTSWLSGEACAFRKKIINEVHEDTLGDDSNIALQLISKGYRVIVNENSHFSEKSPSQVYDYFKIKIRRASGGLQETLRFKFLLFNPKFGRFGLIIFPYRFFSQLVSPIGSIIILVLIIPAIVEISSYFGIYAAVVTAMVLIIAILFLRQKVITYIYTQLIMLIASFLLLTKKVDVRWLQSRTTRL